MLNSLFNTTNNSNLTKKLKLFIITIIGLSICILLVYKLPVATYLFQGLIKIANALLAIMSFSYNYLLPLLILTGSLFVILSNHPVDSLLSLILVFFTMVLLLLSIKVEFLAMIFLIIYVGAIAILFLFIIMIFNLRNLDKTKQPDEFYKSICLFSFLVAPKFYFIVCTELAASVNYNSYFSARFFQARTNPLDYLQHQSLDVLIFSDLLYTEHFVLFLCLSLILLTSMVGAIVLALSTKVKTTY